MTIATPRVSVIVPNYNHAQYLEQRLESILNQTFNDFEIILLDDASSDGSLRVIQAYTSDQRIQLHLNSENSGSPFNQWNKGIKLARGEFLWIAESDDYADKSLLEELVKALDSDDGVGLAYCQSRVVGPVGQSVGKGLLDAPYATFTDGARWTGDFINSGTLELKNFLAFKNTIPNASAVLFRRSLVSDGLTAPEEMRLAGDWKFWAQILARSDIAYIAKPLNYFRVPHVASQRDKTKHQGLELLEGLEVYTFIERGGHLTDVVRRKALQHQVKLWGSLACLRRLSPATNRAIYRKILAAHPEARSTPGRLVLAPFVLHFLTAPVRGIPSAVRAYKQFRRGAQLLFGSKPAS